MKAYLERINRHAPGGRCDVTPLFADASAFQQLTIDLAAPYTNQPPDLVAGIDALGFIVGAAVALHLGRGFLPIRKGGKLPAAADRVTFTDYTGETKSLELRQGSLQPGMRVLLVDEWVETGSQMRAAIRLIQAQGGIIAGIAVLHLDLNEQTRSLVQEYPLHALETEAE